MTKSEGCSTPLSLRRYDDYLDVSFAVLFSMHNVVSAIHSNSA